MLLSIFLVLGYRSGRFKLQPNQQGGFQTDLPVPVLMQQNI